jgi:hypothetical protein
LTKPVTDGFGVNIHFTQPKAGELEMLAEAGFKWIRMDFGWETIEKKKGEYDFKEYEFLMSELEKNNISAYFILDYGNALYGNEKAVISEVEHKAYTQWAVSSVEHFKGRGIIWEIWNEPNGNWFWNGKANVHEFAAMALEASKAIKAKTPNEILIGPAAYGVDQAFLEECFKAGLLNYWDAVSVHPYRHTAPENVASDYNGLKDKIKQYAPKGKTIHVISGEWGYSSIWNNINETVQAKFLPRELLINVMNDIPISIWYDWQDDGTDKKNQEDNFGTVFHEYHSGANPVYEPKEAYLAAKTMYTVLKGFYYVRRIETNDANDYVMLFSDGKNLRLVAWTASAKEHEIKIPSDNCDFELIDHKGSPIEKLSAENGSLTLKINDFTHFIIVFGTNHLLQNGYFYKAIVEPIHGKTLNVKLHNLQAKPDEGTIKLVDVKGIEPTVTEMKFKFTNEREKDISFTLKSKPQNEFTVGFKVESHESNQNFGPDKYHFPPNEAVNDCVITADGDSKIKSEQSIAIHSAPEGLFDSDLPVLKVDYQFFGEGWKFLDIFQNKPENRKIPGEPKGFGIWVYGDNQKMTIAMRIFDASKQVHQLKPEFGATVDWKGWKYVQMNKDDGHWWGPNDGLVHYPVEYQALFLIDNRDHLTAKSTIYITSPVVIY